jgi:rfaE bifunctional protein kinase chain/domain
MNARERVVAMLPEAVLERIRHRAASLTVGVLGDLFLDRYLDVDGELTEKSLETALDAYQVVSIRSSPGAAGTVINNLAALGVRRIVPFAVIGNDGEGLELRRALESLTCLALGGIVTDPERKTPTYMKPMLSERGDPPRELNRLDIKNHVPLSMESEQELIGAASKAWEELDALIVVDHIGSRGTGVITSSVLDWLVKQGETKGDKLILADSRDRIGSFRSMTLKPNRTECLLAAKRIGVDTEKTSDGATALAKHSGRTVFCTDGAEGIWVADRDHVQLVPGVKVIGPIDIVGAGDATAAALACALAAGASNHEAAGFGNWVASITVQKIGTTGTATWEEICKWWKENNETAG